MNSSRKKRRWLWIVGVSLVVAGVAAFVVYSLQPKAVDYKRLVGRWLRPDGGYILVIKDVYANGRIDANYLNPNPINVSEARLSIDSGKVNVFVELRDKGYPGSYYTLIYDPDVDHLVGVYHHLGIRQNFDVFFVRE